MAMQEVSRDPVDKERERARIAADVEAFLRRGGAIEQVGTGAVAAKTPVIGRVVVSGTAGDFEEA